tara:strand:+ start:968 stop:1222 length:255 start_codon:yes stop_codon:yes gene_type:complete
MNNIDIFKKKILYLSQHRGIKEMDLLLGNFVEKYINVFNEKELEELESLLSIDDNTLYSWYLNQKESDLIPNNSVSLKFKKFKL